MRCERITLPSSDGAQVALDLYVPSVYEEIDPQMRRPAIVICPGGGYRYLSCREAEPVALRFLSEGFNCFVIWYRHAPHRYPRPQQDVAAAVAYVRAHADELHTNPNAIAVMGFSAGGHAAGSLGVSWHRGELWQEMGLTPEMVRPNAMVLCYPVITGGEYAHRDSFVALTGSANVRDHLAYSLDTQVTPHCPPTFLWHTFTDQAVPVQNSLMMASALRGAGVSAELRIYPFGRHGLSLANNQVCLGDDLAAVDPDIRTWCALAAQFLKKTFAEA